MHDFTHIQALLLAWFATEGRDLPWRRTRNAYHILVSEVMLQQTQVDRVIPKYAAFLEAFPSLEALAAAPTADVIRAWAGLGYNRRALNLQRTARVVLDQYAGQFPHTVEELLSLPGIGSYTAGAIACFAFEQDVAFIDTNIRRAVRRILFGEAQGAVSERTLLQHATRLVPDGKGWAWNQAIMELGARICTASSPACWRCPVRSQCSDYAQRSQADTTVFDQALPPVRAPTPARRIAERRTESYAGSNRFYRGRVVALLREAPAGLALHQLGPLVRDDYGPEQQEWLEQLTASLARDGLVVIAGDVVRLPE